MEFSREEYWTGLPCPPPGNLPNPGTEPRSPALQVGSLLSKPLGKPKNTGVGSLPLLQGIFLTQESNRGLPVWFIAGGFFTSWAARKAFLCFGSVSGAYSHLKFFLSVRCPYTLGCDFLYLPTCQSVDLTESCVLTKPLLPPGWHSAPNCLTNKKSNSVVQVWEQMEGQNSIWRKENLNHILQITVFTAHKQGTLAKPVWDMSWKPGPDPGNRQASSSVPVTAGNRKNNPRDSENAKENSASCFFL